MLMYNFVSAFAACLVIILLGEVLSKFTKGWVPSVFISAVLILIAFWTFLPKTLVADSKLLPLGSSVAIFLLITHMGTLFSLERLLQQWKTVVICIAGLAGLVGLCWFVGPLFMDRTLVIAIVMYCVQGFAGYPLTAVCLKLEARRQLAAFRAGKVEDKGEDARKVMADALAMPGNESKQGVLATPKAWNTPYFVLLKVSLVAWLAFVLGVLTPVNGAIWALVCGVVFCRLGFLEPNVLSRTGSKDFLFLALIMFVYSGLGDSNPEMMAKLICPMVLLIIIGVVGMAVVAAIVGRFLKISPYLGFATCLTALYGFPFDAIMTERICQEEGADKAEVDFLMSRLFPPMIVGGFVTVTITSVILAGFFVKLF